MKTPRFRTHREAVIVKTSTRITLPSTSAAADLKLEDSVFFITDLKLNISQVGSVKYNVLKVVIHLFKI